MIGNLTLPLNGGPRDKAHLMVALAIAHAQGAALEAVFLEPELDMPVAILGRGASANFLAQSAEAADQVAAKAEAWLHATLADESAITRWTVERGNAEDILVRHSRTSDLLLLGQDDTHGSIADVLSGVSCGVLVIPRTEPPAQPGRRVLVAWDHSHPAARAVREAMPFLHCAKQVVIATIGASEAVETDLAALDRYLKLHDVRAESHCTHASDGQVGPALLACARSQGSDLIVMGGYGRGRLIESLLGGTTQYMLAHSSVPLLLAH